MRGTRKSGIEGADHYGWIQVTAGSIGNGGWIKDWAYNSAPGEMIFAGQVPEPSTWALLIGGGGLLWWRMRRDNNRKLQAPQPVD